MFKASVYLIQFDFLALSATCSRYTYCFLYKTFIILASPRIPLCLPSSLLTAKALFWSQQWWDPDQKQHDSGGGCLRKADAQPSLQTHCVRRLG